MRSSTSEKRPDLVLERRFVAAFGRLLQQLGLGNARADAGLLELLGLAEVEVRRLKERLAYASSVEAVPQRVTIGVEQNASSNDRVHHVQYRALDEDDQVHIRGEWVPESQGYNAELKIRNEMLALQAAGYDLRLVKYQRCSHLNLTKVAQDEPPAPF